MDRVKLSEDLRPLSDLETQAPEIIQQARTTGRPVVLTREGHGVAVLLSVEAFEQLQSSSERRALQRAVGEAEQDIAEGHWVESSEVLAKLKRWSTVSSERPAQWVPR
jgi:antitoxin YefM